MELIPGEDFGFEGSAQFTVIRQVSIAPGKSGQVELST
jgi:hypothetical protein